MILRDSIRLAQEQGNTGIPVNAILDGIGNLVSLWDNISIDSSATSEGDAVATWTDTKGDNDASGGTSPELHLGTKGGARQVTFNGTSDWLNVGQPANLDFVPQTDEFSIVARLGDNPPTTGYIISKAPADTGTRQWGFIKSDSGGNYIAYVGGQAYNSSAISSVANQLLVITVSTTTIKMYADGVEIMNTALLGTATNSNNVNIGSRTDGGFLLDGDLDFIAVYNKELSASDLNTIDQNFNINVVDEAQDFIDAVGTLTTAQEDAVRDLVTALKANGTWSKYKAIYPFVGGTAAAHKFNLVNALDTDAAFRLDFNGTWTHSSDGVEGDGSTAYADTHFVPNAELTGDSYSLGAYFGETVNEAAGFGVKDGGTPFWTIYSGYNNTTIYSYAGSSGNSVTSVQAERRGLIMHTQNGGTTHKLWMNGTQIGSTNTGDNQASFNGIDLPMYIGAVNRDGSAGEFSSKKISFVFFAEGLSDAEVVLDTDDIQAFQAALGREFVNATERKHVITLQASEVSGSTDLIDFPVLIGLDNLDAEVYDGGANSARSGGGDIIFTSDAAGTNRLSCEIVAFEPSATPANRKCQIWVKVPTLSATVNTEIYIWYKHPTRNQPAVDAAFGRNSVWTKYNFMSHDGITDSSGNYTITQTIAATSTEEFLDADVPVFDGADYHTIDLSGFDITTIRVVGCWAKQSGNDVADRIMAFASASSPGDVIQIATGVGNGGSDGAWYGGMNDSNTYGTRVENSAISANTTNNTFHKLVLHVDDVAGIGDNPQSFYVDDLAAAAGAGLNYQNDDFLDQMAMGGRTGGGSGLADASGHYFWTTTDLGLDWIRTEYNNQSDRAAFGVAGTPSTDDF